MKDVNDLEIEIKDISQLEQAVFDSAMTAKIEKQDDFKNIQLREDIVIVDDIQKSMRQFIDLVSILEKELRNLLK